MMNIESDESKRKRRGRGGAGGVLVDDSIEKQAETNLPTVQIPSSPSHGITTTGHIVADNITPCPRFDRLRASAKDDRHGIHLKRLQEAKRVEESRQRRTVASRSITMNDFYATLFLPTVSSGNAVDSGTGGNAIATSTTPSPPLQLSDRDVILKDVEESFIACYYKMYPEALERRKEAEEEAERRRRSTIAAAQLASLASDAARRRNTSTTSKKGKGKKKRKETVVPREGSPASNLSVLLSALIGAGDSKGLITQDALADVLAKPPFEVKDTSALEAFFFAVRSSSTVKDAAESDSERRLNNSCSTTASIARGFKRTPSMRISNAQCSPSAIALSPSSPFTSAVTLQASVRRGPPTAGGSMSNIRRTGFTPRSSRVFNTSSAIAAAAAAAVASSAGVGSSGAEMFPTPVVRVREVLAAVDAVMNGPELRDVVRSICFGVLESDGFIHKATLRTLRLTRREACEDKSAVVTPSIVKALGDALEVMLQEEEQEYIRTQLKDKRRKNKSKAPTLLPHQKSAIPLHMMRRSHMSRKEFLRFFDELPFFAASFMHVWFPAFFSTNWPPIKQSAGYDPHTDDPIDDDFDDNENSNTTNNNVSNMTSNSNAFSHGAFGEVKSQREVFDWEKVATGSLALLLRSPVQRRNLARKMVSERLDHMKLSVSEDSDVMS